MSSRLIPTSLLTQSLRPVTQAVLLACLGAGAVAQSVPTLPAGTLEFVQGSVNVRSAAGATRAAQRGTVVNNGEAIETQSGRAQMRMVDGAYISLQNDTTLRLDNYRVASATEAESGLMSLVRGGLRTVTGLIGRSNKQNYRLQTATATIGIRGTGYSATSSDDGTRVRVSEGQIALCTQRGCLDLSAQQSGFANNSNTLPVRIALAPVLQPTAAPSVVVATSPSQSPRDIEVAKIVEEQRPPVVVSPEFSTRTPLTSPSMGLGAAFSVSVPLAELNTFFTAGLLGGAITFDAQGRMIEFVDGTQNFGFRATAANITDFGSDGIVAWGRWNGGTFTDFDGGAESAAAAVNTDLSINHLTYVTGNSGAAVPVTGSFSVFGSTAPVIINPTNGSVVGSGASNSVTGSMTVNFPGATGGSLTYNLVVPVGGQNFTLNGTAAQYNGTGFLGSSSTITSSGSACANNACSGTTPYGDAIQGAIFGVGNTRIGAQYGFATGLGGVTGAVALRPTTGGQ